MDDHKISYMFESLEEFLSFKFRFLIYSETDRIVSYRISIKKKKVWHENIFPKFVCHFSLSNKEI